MQSSICHSKRVFDFNSDGYGYIVSFLEDSVSINKPKDSRDICRVKHNHNSKNKTLRTHRTGK